MIAPSAREQRPQEQLKPMDDLGIDEKILVVASFLSVCALAAAAAWVTIHKSIL